MSLIDIVLLIAGIYTFYGVAFKPHIFWDRGRILRTREMIGDRKTELLYYIVALVMIAVSIWGATRSG